MIFINELLLEYDDIMIGKRDSYSSILYDSKGIVSENYAISIIRYALVHYLGWNKRIMLNCLNYKVMKQMHLQELMKFIEYPVEYDKQKDYFYLVTLLYKEETLSFRDMTIHIYEKILSGLRSKYPKDYFSGSDGRVRAGICMQYFIEHYVPFSSLNDLYYFFSTAEGYKMLENYKLINACNELFETPVDYLYFSLPDDQKNSLYHNYYRYKYDKENSTSKKRRQRKHEMYKLKGCEM